MDKMINASNFNQFCFTNEKQLKSDPIGLVIDFRGLNASSMISEWDTSAFDSNNILYMIPYLNPWNWMNDFAIEETEDLIQAIKDKYHIPNLKIASIGGSMGGMCALTYAAYAKQTPVIVAANCPVCDFEYHMTERPDLPRTIYSAYYNPSSNLPFQEAIASHSPLRLAERKKLPQTKYVLFHCEKDSQVNIEKHTQKLIQAMGNAYDLTYYFVKERDHCDLDPESRKKYLEVIIQAFL